MANVIDSTNVGSLLQGIFTKIKNAFWQKSEVTELPIDATPTASSNNLVKSGGVYSAVHPAFGSSQPSGGMLPNVLYKLGTLTGTVSITFVAATDATIENEYKFTFTAGSTAPTITWPASITGWVGNCVENGAPVITGGNYYEVSVMDGIALIAEVEA